MTQPDNSKKVFSATDAAPAVLYAKRSFEDQHTYPVISNTSGALVIAQEDTISQMFLDYGSRTDGQPIYIGYGARGLATGEEGWLLYKHTYNSSSFMVSRQIAYDSWDNRETTTYA